MRRQWVPRQSKDQGLLRLKAAVLEWLEDRRLMSSAAGVVYNDLDGDGTRDAGEGALAGWTVYLDQNRNHVRDAGEAFTQSAADGSYLFDDLAAGTYFIGEQVPSNWEQTSPGSAGTITGFGGGASPAPPPGSAQVEVLPTVAPMRWSTTTSASPAPVEVEGDEAIPVPADAESNTLINLSGFRSDARFTGVDGSGYSVAVLDTGIDVNHPFFGPDADGNGVADRIVYQHDFANNDDDASDVNGHGSNVAGIVGGQNATNSGMAPGAGIVALKVFTDAGSGQFAYIESALQWVVANAATYNIVSVNMSLSDSQNYNLPVSLYGLGDEMATLASMGIVVCSAAGNDFYPKGSVPGVAYPAADPNSLAISAVWDANAGSAGWANGAQDFSTGPDRVTSFSQRHPTLTDIFAPGAYITGPNATGGTVAYAGTSQASPHIAGIAALAQDLADQYLGRRLSVSEFRTLLRNTADTIFDGDDENDNVTNTQTSYPRVNVENLADAIVSMGAGYPFGHSVTLVGDGDDKSGLDFGARHSATAPSAPALRSTSDTGASSSDRVTRNDNSSAGKALSFDVGNTFAGMTVRLYAAGNLIGSAAGVDGTTTVTTNGTLDLTDGAHTITARQFGPGQSESPNSSSLSVTIDTASPTGSAGSVSPAAGTTATSFNITFSDGGSGIDVASLDNFDVRVTGPNGFDQAATFVSFSPSGNGSPRTATYSIAAPGGTWDGADAGSYSVVLQSNQVNDVAGNSAAGASAGSFNFSLAPAQSPFHGSPFAVGATPVTIQAEDYDLGGEGIAFHDTTANNIGNVYRTSEAVDVKLIANTTNQYRLSDAAVGEWVEYSINVQQAGNYELEIRLSNADPNGRVHLEVDGVNVTGSITVPDTNSFSTFQSTKRTFALTTGAHVLRLAMDAAASTGSVAGMDWMKLTFVPPTGPSTTLNATMAAYVRGGSTAGATNFGSSADLVVRKASTTGSTREAYIKFDLSSLSSITTAKLRLSGRISDASSASIVTQIFSSSNTTWNESTLTWNNKPASGSTVRGSVTVSGTTAKTYEIDLSSFLKSEFAAGRKVVTLVLKNASTTTAQTIFASDETANGPQLVIT
jgi:subtilisin family serine protease